MSVSSISELAHQHMLSILGYSSGQPGQASNTANANSGSLSSFGQMLAQLQQMEESSPNQYAKVSQQISTNLAAAASTAQVRGDTSFANQLATLSKDFSTASQTGQLPNIRDLETAMHNAGRQGTAASSTTLPASGKHSGAINIIGQVLSMAGI